MTITVSDLNNDSGCEGYADFTSIIAEEPHTISVSINESDHQLSAWIDFNDDGTFSVDETIVPNFVIAPGEGAGTFTESVFFNILSDVPPGMHRMRLKSNWQAEVPDDACEATTYGETEDYTVNIVY